MSDKRKHLRKRKAVEDEEDEQDGPTESGAAVWDKLQDTKLLQKQRQRNTGLPAEALALGAREETAEAPEAKPAQEDGTDLLEAYVKEQTTTDAAEDPHMEKYITDQMKKRLGKSAESSDADVIKTVQERDEEELYSIPDHLKGQVSKQSDVASYMTGITEVQLPLEFKLKNIEETEAAKKKMLQQAAGFGRRHLDDDDEDEHRPRNMHAIQAQRAAYPRDFGRQKGPDERVVRPADKTVRDWKHKKSKPDRPAK
ncbi:hypothetical protein WJX72_008601 [[Myrmecia] bisecta]|uniref:Hepatocellular carcinoma-associated antigen 59 n=1 Tax=[Myrmecia] bisecta TaxID=41462 RepID=A0AAW1R981_9CHLO